MPSEASAKEGEALAEQIPAGKVVRYVHLLKSRSHPGRKYVGSTDDLQRRLAEHNAGKSRHTCKFVPWECVVAVRFRDDARAEAFEKYLKSGSRHAFARRHFW